VEQGAPPPSRPPRLTITLLQAPSSASPPTFRLADGMPLEINRAPVLTLLGRRGRGIPRPPGRHGSDPWPRCGERTDFYYFLGGADYFWITNECRRQHARC